MSSLISSSDQSKLRRLGEEGTAVSSQASTMEIDIVFQIFDLAIDIFCRFPAKSVLRLQCVSKGWKDITSDTSFRQVHSQRSKPTLSGFFFQERFQLCHEDIESISYIPVDSESSTVHSNIFDFLPEKVVLMASSNGLLCCRSCRKAYLPVLYICNPSNKEYITLEWDGPSEIESIAFTIDPSKCSKGSLDLTSFKLVSVHKIEDEMDSYFSFEIYSSKTGKWISLIEEDCTCDFSLFKNRGVFANGFLYWLTDGDVLLAFDVEQEQSWLIGPPPMPANGFSAMCIGESDGDLHYIEISEAGIRDWFLEGCSEPTWFLKHSISRTIMEEEHPSVFQNMAKRVTMVVNTDPKPWLDPLAFKDGILFMTVCAKVYSYNLDTRKIIELCRLDCLGPNSFGIGSPIVLPYSLSLVPLECP